MAVLTLSRQFGSRGDELARELAFRTGFRLVTRADVEQTMRTQFGVEPPRVLETAAASSSNGGHAGNGNSGQTAASLPAQASDRTSAGRGANEPNSSERGPLDDAEVSALQRTAAEISLYADMLAAVVADLAARENIVLVGRGGQFLFADAACALHVRVVAPRPWRAATVAASLGLAPPIAAELVAQRDAAQARYLRAVFGRSALQSELYHLVINTAALDFEQAVALALQAAEGANVRKAGLLSTNAADRLRLRSKLRLARRFASLPGSPLLENVPFAHPSERVFARLMDFYGVDWEYEPRTFPIEWNERNEVAEAFTPDFYLPELDLYVELTMMKQSLVTRKNRKVKRLRELYPDVNIRVFYQKDVEDLIFKLGAHHPVLAERPS